MFEWIRRMVRAAVLAGVKDALAEIGEVGDLPDEEEFRLPGSGERDERLIRRRAGQ